MKYAITFIVACLFAPAYAQDLALTGATLYDGNGGPPLSNATVLVAAGRVTCVGDAAGCPVPPGTERVDLSSAYITPGLVDAHVHYAQTGWLNGRPDAGVANKHYDYEAIQQSLSANPDRWNRAYLCSGVTAVFDPGGLPWTLGLEAGAEGHPERPHIQAAGPVLVNTERTMDALGTSTFWPMRTDEEATVNVRRLAAMGARAIKVIFLKLPAEEAEVFGARLVQIGEAARAEGLPLIVHATNLRDAKHALRAGAAMLVHSVHDDPVDEEFLRLARKAGTVYAPTLLVHRNWVRAVSSAVFGVAHTLDDPNSCIDAETRRLIAGAPALRGAPERFPDLTVLFALLEAEGHALAVMKDNLIRVHEAGIPIVTSTDAGNPLTPHGPSIYPEMEAMESAGLTPSEVLVMSTRNGAAMMGRLEDFGTLEAGKLANLIVLAQDPGASTSAFRSITHVMRGGVLRPISHFAAD